MIAADTSTLIAFLAGELGRDVDTLDQHLAKQAVHIPPVVLSELLSAPAMPSRLEELLGALPVLPLLDGYWERAGRTRRSLLARGLKAPLADALICQSCLDHEIPLLTRDRDFRPFARHAGLDLA